MPFLYRVSRIHVASYIVTSAPFSSPHEIGAFYFNPEEHGERSAELRTIISSVDEKNSTAIKLWNATDKKYVCINGKESYELATTSSNPETISSINLYEADNFNVTSAATYVLHLYGTGYAPIAQHYSTEFISR